MNRVFLTGMGRSGTSLLDKLLGAMPAIDMLSQPFPLIFVEAKRRYLERIGRNDYYVLNDDRVSRTYSPEDFTDYLSTMAMAPQEIEQLFTRMRGYSGQKTRPDRAPAVGRDDVANGFAAVLDRCLEYFALDAAASFVGIKEIMCEEFIPYLLATGHKCIVILRDPRDVLASANHPRGEKFIGDRKPTLFLLRTWRKSAEFAWSLRESRGFLFLRYEDLVADTVASLERISRLLGLECEWRSSGCVRDRFGRPWKANSSRVLDGTSVSAAAVGSYRGALSHKEIAYAEAVCGYEMDWLGYARSTDADPAEVIGSFRDDSIGDTFGLPGDFSHRPKQIERELARVEAFRTHYL